MPGTTDDIRSMTAAIGGLEAFAEAVGRKLERMDDKLDKLIGVKDRVDRIEPLVDSHERYKNQGKGAAAAFGATAGGVVMAVIEFFKTMR